MRRMFARIRQSRQHTLHVADFPAIVSNIPSMLETFRRMSKTCAACSLESAKCRQHVKKCRRSVDRCLHGGDTFSPTTVSALSYPIENACLVPKGTTGDGHALYARVGTVAKTATTTINQYRKERI
jgi:hypothetical protein